MLQAEISENRRDLSALLWTASADEEAVVGGRFPAGKVRADGHSPLRASRRLCAR